MTTATKSKTGSLGRKLRRYRRGRNLTQTELAQAAGISVDTVGKLELGYHQRPHPTTLRKLAAALDVDVEDLTGGVGR